MLEQAQEPYAFVLGHNRDEKSRNAVPWTWRFVMHPIDKTRRVRDFPHRSIDLFAKGCGREEWLHKVAVIIQSAIRRKLATMRVKKRREKFEWVTKQYMDSSFEKYYRRRSAAVKIQKRARGMLVRNDDVIAVRTQKWEGKIVPKLVVAQAYFQLHLARKWISVFHGEGRREA